MKKQILSVLSWYQKIPYKIVRLLGKSNNFVNREMLAACKASDSETKEYVSYRLRPKKMEAIPVLETLEEKSKIAIVIQGPLLLSDDFTLETAVFYKRCYPNAIVILSSWKGADEKTIEKLQVSGIIVVLSDLPQKPGNLNINYQVTNTYAGIRKAKELGAEFVCKTRTDQRLYHPNAIMHLLNLVNTFPVNNDDFTTKQKKRIVTVSMPYGDMFYPYCLSDFLYFGNTDDMLELFSIEPDSRGKGTGGKGMSRKRIAEEQIAPEIQILRSYIATMGGNNECTIRAYWQFVKNHIISINRNEIGLFWPKYENRYSENTHFGYYYQIEEEKAFHCYSFDFIHWLALYNGTLIYEPEYEKYAEYVL